MNDETYLSCPSCRDLFRIFKRINASNKNRLKILTIYAMASFDKHCMFCEKYKPRSPERCVKGMSTGMSLSIRNSYPFSFANHGCGSYKKAKV